MDKPVSIKVEDLTDEQIAAIKAAKVDPLIYAQWLETRCDEVITDLTAARLALKECAEALDSVWYSEFSNNETCMEGRLIKDTLTKHAAEIEKTAQSQGKDQAVL